MTLLSTTETNLRQAGVWFLIAGAQPLTIMHALGPFVPVAGKAARVSAAGVFSSRGPVPIVGGTYPGYDTAPSFTASAIYLATQDPSQGSIFNKLNGVQLGEISVSDLNPGDQPFCYAEHRHDVVYPFQPGDLDGQNRWLLFVAWCSSAPATANDWLNWEQGNGECFFEAETEYVPS